MTGAESKSESSVPLPLAERIRAYVHRRYVVPARAAGSVVIDVRAGDIHAAMGLTSRIPAVCSALGGKFEREYAVELMDRKGPPQGADVRFRFCIRSNRENAALAQRSYDQQPRPMSKPERNSELPGTSNTVPRRSSSTVYLVSCVSQKRRLALPARDLYVSSWFDKARAYIERTEATWYILSAEHGLLPPERVIEPYERTLNTMRDVDRRRWADTVYRQIGITIPEARHFTFLAGMRYREFLSHMLTAAGFKVEVPMEGLRIGEQLAWLGQQ